MLLITLFICAESSLTIGKIDSGLDPGRITWWKESWSHSGLTLSENHAKTGLTLTLRFRPSTTVSNGVVEVKFPSGVSHSSLSNSVYTVAQSVSADNDEIITITNVSITNSGQYGPFAITTRRFSTGQTVDTNNVFGSVYVYPAVSDQTSLEVASATGNTQGVVGSTDTLSFAFSISEDLWKYDIIQITPSTYYTPSTSVTCVSADVTENNNLALGPDGTHTLPCEVSSNTIVVYGLSQDIQVNSQVKLKIEVSSFSLPAATYTTGYSWSVSVYRFATSTLLARFTSDGMPLTVQTGVIDAQSWSTHTSYTFLSLVPNLEVFTDVLFTLQNAIPASGQITINFSSVDIQSPIWYYGESDLSGVVNGICVFTPYTSGDTCTVNSSTQLTLTLANGLAMASEVRVTTLTRLLASPKVSRITSYNSGGQSIDRTALNPLQLTLSSEYTLLQSFEIESNTDESLDTGTGRWGTGSSGYLFFKLRASEAWSALASGNGATLELSCPMSTATADFFSIYLPSSTTWQEKTDTNSAIANNLTGEPTVTATEVSGSITLNPIAVSTDAFYTLGASGTMQMPLAASSPSTFYECVVRVSEVSNFSTSNEETKYQIGAARFSVVPAEPAVFSIGLFCNQGIAGIPLVFSYTGEFFELSFTTKSFQLVVELTGFDLALGPSSIPVWSDGQSSLAGTFSFSSNSVVTVSGFSSSVPIGTDFKVYLPNAQTVSGTVNYSVKIQFSESTYGTDLVVLAKTGSFSNLNNAGSITASGSGSYNPSSTYAIDFSLQSQSSVNDNFFGIIAPAGLDLTIAHLQVAGNNPAKTISLVSSDPAFAGNVMIGLESSTFRVDDSPVTLSIRDAITPQTAVSLPFGFFEANQSSEFPDEGVCFAHNSAGVTYNVQAPTFSSITVAMSSCKKRGPTNVNTQMTVSLRITHPVPVGGIVSLDVHSSWTPSSYAACTSSTGDQCTIAGSSVSITLATALANNDDVQIIITGLLAPSTGSDGDSITLLASAKTSYNGNDIESNTSVSNTCTLGSSDSVDELILTIDAYPNAPGLSEVAFYMSMLSALSFPENSIIQITPGFTSWLYTGSNISIKDSCWTSLPYSNCIVSSGNVEIQISEELPSGAALEIYLDKAIDLPASAGTSTSGVTVVVYWSGVKIAETIPSVSFVTNTSVLGSISPNSLTSTVTNAGAESTLTFSFTSDQVVDSSHEFWIVFPNTYDAFVGNAWLKRAACNPGTYYIDCSSSELGDIECTVDHWMVVVSSPSSVSAEQAISIDIKTVQNPTELASTQNFQLFQVDSSGSVIAFTQSFGTLTITSLAPPLTVKSVEISSNYLRESTTYSIEFYIDLPISSGNTIEIVFPRQYDIDLSRGLSDIDCNSVYFDESSTSTSQTSEVSWTSQESCTVENNYVKLVSDAARTFSSTDKIRINILTMPNPQWGLSRTTEALLYDTEENTVFSSLDLWTERFEVLVYDETDSSYLARSYYNLHSGYLGFDSQDQDTFAINGYNPATGANSIQVYPGSQTHSMDITLSWPLISETLTLTPSVNENTPDNGGLIIESEIHSFKFYQWHDKINFRVAAQSSLNSGLYYIEWAVTETLEDGNNSAKYASPARTLVEVCTSATNFYTISVETIPNLYRNYTNIPIKMTTQRPPAADMTVSMAFINGNEISVNPSTLTFGRFVDTLYFAISVGTEFQGTTDTLEFDVSGVNAGLYSNIPAITVSVTSDVPSSPTAVTISTSSLTAHSVTVSLVSQQTGLFYWWLGCEGTAAYSNFTAMKSGAPDLFTSPRSLDLSFKPSYESTEVNIDSNRDSDITEFLRRKYSEHCGSVWTSAEVLYSGRSRTITLDWLQGYTKYTFTGYLDTFSSVTPSASTVDFTTLQLPQVYILEIEIQNDVDQTQETTVREIVANRIGINPLWLTDSTYRQTTTASSTFFKWNVLYSRELIDFTPANMVSRSNQLDLAKQDIVDNGFASSTSQVKFYSGTYTIPSTPLWQSAPSLLGVGTYTANFTVVSTANGLACVSCAKESSANTNSNQVLAGLTADSQVADGSQCLETVASTSDTLTVRGLKSSTGYYCYFTICNEYPLWPDCLNSVILEVLDFNTSVSSVTQYFGFAQQLALTSLIIALTSI